MFVKIPQSSPKAKDGFDYICQYKKSLSVTVYSDKRTVYH